MLRSYCAVLLAASALGGVCASLADRAFAKYLRYLTALVCVLLVISPFRSLDLPGLFSTAGGTLPETETVLPSAAPSVETETRRRLEAWFADELFSDTGIKARVTGIQIDWSEADPVIERLSFCPEAPSEQTEETILRWAQTRFGLPCSVDAP